MLNAVKHPRRRRDGLPAVLEMLHSAKSAPFSMTGDTWPVFRGSRRRLADPARLG